MTNSRGVRMSIALWFSVLVLWGASCRYEPPRVEGLDPKSMPEEVRADYALFALRCSKCHSLARPLQSGITDDNYWAEYVERMRRQPGSDITLEETVPILRFLHYRSTGQLAKREPLPNFPPIHDGGQE
jgi:hypothetical protein